MVGFDLGPAVTPSLIAAQSSVQWNERGVVTGVNLFARSIGSTVGVAVFVAPANGVITGGGERDPGTMDLASGLVFSAVAVCAGLTLPAAAALPRARVADTEDAWT